MTQRDGRPQEFGPYRVLRRIGEGGMGVVYLAVDSAQRQVAIKALRPAVAGERDARRRLAREVETMRRVRSPYVAEVLDADLTCEPPYIVTQYVRGRTLDQLVKTYAPIEAEVSVLLKDPAKRTAFYKRLLSKRQIGTPREIYENPVDSYVAARLGAPGINLVSHALFPAIRAPAAARTIGVRTEHVHIRKGVNGNAAGTVTWIEHLGDQNHLHVGLPDGKLVTLGDPDAGLTVETTERAFLSKVVVATRA